MLLLLVELDVLLDVDKVADVSVSVVLFDVDVVDEVEEVWVRLVVVVDEM